MGRVMICIFLTVLALASANAEPKSYDNYKVFRVEIPSEEHLDSLAGLKVHFWNQGRIGMHADVMVAPHDIPEIEYELKLLGFKYSIMVDNVGDLMRLEKVSNLFQVLHI